MAAQAAQLLAHGWQIHQRKQFTQAEKIYRDVLTKEPQNANAWCYLGMTLHDQKRFAEAVQAYRSALTLHADFPIALNNLGNSLRYVNEYEEADTCFQKAIDLKPDYVNAFKNRGTLHVWTGNLERGLKCYEQALEINPQEAELHRNLGVIYLLQGRFQEGWREYRWRWKVGDLHRPNVGLPVWDGKEIAGKRLLLTAEQGLGDTINFVRFAKALRERGARTLVYCQPQLLALLQQNRESVGQVYPNNLGLPSQLDAQASLLDVADYLSISLETIPSEPSYLSSPQHLRDFWRQRLNQIVPGAPDQTSTDKKLRIGISWQGNPDHQADMFRSIPLQQFECLAQVEGVTLVSLQQGFGSEQLKTWTSSPIITLGDQVDKSSGAFVDTAAIMQELDLVITSDTAIAHVAGAVGVPTWVALNSMPDWRWLLDREDTPWYPSVRLFRQKKIADWSTVFAEMAQELKTLVATH